MSARATGREVTVTGFDELFKVMDDLADEVGQRKVDRIWTSAMRKAMQPVLDAAKAQAPKNTEGLMNALYVKAHKPRARDKQSASYQGESIMARVSIANERPESVRKYIVNKKGKLQSSIQFQGSNKPVALAMEFGTAKVAPHPFLRLALESTSGTVQTILGNEVWHVLETKYSKVRTG
jgi:HK97 gp10 family phage protein